MMVLAAWDLHPSYRWRDGSTLRDASLLATIRRAYLAPRLPDFGQSLPRCRADRVDEISLHIRPQCSPVQISSVRPPLPTRSAVLEPILKEFGGRQDRSAQSHES